MKQIAFYITLKLWKHYEGLEIAQQFTGLTALPEDAGSTQHPQGTFQVSGTLVLGDPTPPSGLHRHHIHTVLKQTWRQNLHASKIKKKQKTIFKTYETKAAV